MIEHPELSSGHETQPSGDGLLVIICGPSGVGKDTIMKDLLEEKSFSRIITTTTRPIRINETEGIDYHFVSKDQFEKMISTNVLAEYVKYGDHYKGTTKDSLLQAINTNGTFIWRIDMSRAAKTEKSFKNLYDPETADAIIEKTVVILLGISRLTQLKDRISKRGDLGRGEFIKRLKKDWDVWNNLKKQFNNIIICCNPNSGERLEDAIKKTSTGIIEVIEKHNNRLSQS
ncbi:guanylate kinase [Patescibacteria group bacterium]